MGSTVFSLTLIDDRRRTRFVEPRRAILIWQRLHDDNIDPLYRCPSEHLGIFSTSQSRNIYKYRERLRNQRRRFHQHNRLHAVCQLTHCDILPGEFDFPIRDFGENVAKFVADGYFRLLASIHALSKPFGQRFDVLLQLGLNLVLYFNGVEGQSLDNVQRAHELNIGSRVGCAVLKVILTNIKSHECIAFTNQIA